MDKTLITLVSIVLLLLATAIIYFLLYQKVISVNPSYNFLKYLQGDQ